MVLIVHLLLWRIVLHEWYLSWHNCAWTAREVRSGLYLHWLVEELTGRDMWIVLVVVLILILIIVVLLLLLLLEVIAMNLRSLGI